MTLSTINSVVIVGGGTAGWLTAGLLAAKTDDMGSPRFQVTVLEPPGIAPIGVGEGTWPSMRLTLSQIGVGERDFLKQTGASFKQGTKFENWRFNKGEHYYHPFDAPKVHGAKSPFDAWKASGLASSFAQFVGIQEDLCEANKSPKMQTSRDFVGVTNYGYHFEADGMAVFLKTHCVNNLNVTLVADKMIALETHSNGDLKAIITEESGDVEGDFFVDCTGFRGLLIKRHFKTQTHSLEKYFSCDRAVVARIPYHDSSQIASTTVSTAQEAGWIWDVSLAKRYGVGYVHSSAHTSSERAHEILGNYVERKGYNPDQISFRELKFEAGYVDKCWQRNCVAIGLSSGFIEPLEASSIMLTETAARELTHDLAAPELDMSATSERFNKRFSKRWTQVVHFLKFHYVMSQREEDFWIDHRRAERVPETLWQDLTHWKESGDLDGQSESGIFTESLFPLDSYKFIYYALLEQNEKETGPAYYSPQKARVDQHMRLMPTNKEWLGYL